MSGGVMGDEMPTFQIYSADSVGALTLRRELMDATDIEALDIMLRMQQASPKVQTWFLNCEPDEPGEPQRLN
jgi:hypothetical protein